MKVAVLDYASGSVDIFEVPEGSFYVDGPFGFKQQYFVVTRTIEK